MSTHSSPGPSRKRYYFSEPEPERFPVDLRIAERADVAPEIFTLPARDLASRLIQMIPETKFDRPVQNTVMSEGYQTQQESILLELQKLNLANEERDKRDAERDVREVKMLQEVEMLKANDIKKDAQISKLQKVSDDVRLRNMLQMIRGSRARRAAISRGIHGGDVVGDLEVLERLKDDPDIIELHEHFGKYYYGVTPVDARKLLDNKSAVTLLNIRFTMRESFKKPKDLPTQLGNIDRFIQEILKAENAEQKAKWQA